MISFHVRVFFLYKKQVFEPVLKPVSNLDFVQKMFQENEARNFAPRIKKENEKRRKKVKKGFLEESQKLGQSKKSFFFYVTMFLIFRTLFFRKKHS